MAGRRSKNKCAINKTEYFNCQGSFESLRNRLLKLRTTELINHNFPQTLDSILSYSSSDDSTKQSKE